MRKHNLISLAVMVAGLLMAGRAMAGNLDPTNAPGPTMHTLEEIYQKVSALSTNAGGGASSAAVLKTGQTDSYQDGDDGTYQKGAAWPNPRFTVQADTNCVLDNLTGLIWARNANMAGEAMTWSDAVIYCETLNYGGQSDWRLPNRNELTSLIDTSKFSPALPTEHPFADVQSSSYWSSTAYAYYANFEWYVDMSSGFMDGYDGASTYYVWPVRGGK